MSKSLRQIVEDHLCESLPKGLAKAIRDLHCLGRSREEILAVVRRSGATQQTVTGLMCEAYLNRLEGGQP